MKEKCPKCQSDNVFAAFDMFGEPCLFCIDCYVNLPNEMRLNLNNGFNILPPYVPQDKTINLVF